MIRKLLDFLVDFVLMQNLALTAHLVRNLYIQDENKLTHMSCELKNSVSGFARWKSMDAFCIWLPLQNTHSMKWSDWDKFVELKGPLITIMQC